MLSVRPGSKTITRLADTMLNRMFRGIYNGRRVVYNAKDILTLLNRVVQRGGADIPNNIKGPWGQMIAAAISQKNCMHTMGVRGHKHKRMNKEAIVGSAMVFNQNNDLENTQWIKQLQPHKDKDCERDARNKIIAIRRNFDNGNSDMICSDHKYTRNSLEYILRIEKRNKLRNPK